MIPFIPLNESITLLNYEFYLFGSIFILAIIVAAAMAFHRGHQHQIDPWILLHGAVFVLPAALISGHVLDIIFYSPWWFNTPYWQNALLDFKGTKSSYGAFAGTLVSFLLYVKIRGLDSLRLRLADIVTEAIVVGLTIGRLGCALTHDHPGSPSSFLLAVAYPGGARHDLGLYEFIFCLLVLLPLALYLSNRKLMPGLLTATIIGIYSVVRFFLDFLRVDDARYFYMTPAQYYSLIALALVLGVVCGRLARRSLTLEKVT